MISWAVLRARCAQIGHVQVHHVGNDTQFGAPPGGSMHDSRYVRSGPPSARLLQGNRSQYLANLPDTSTEKLSKAIPIFRRQFDVNGYRDVAQCMPEHPRRQWLYRISSNGRGRSTRNLSTVVSVVVKRNPRWNAGFSSDGSPGGHSLITEPPSRIHQLVSNSLDHRSLMAPDNTDTTSTSARSVPGKPCLPAQARPSQSRTPARRNMAAD